MPKLTDDPKVAAAIEKAEARGANAERKRISAILTETHASVKDAGDKAATRPVGDFVKTVKTRIREEA
jgi:hypothetical protein